jgi:hypothetical protein
MALEWFSKALHNIQQQTLRPDDRVFFKKDGTYGTVRRMFGNDFYEIMLADGQILGEPVHLDFLDQVPLPSEIKRGDRTFADGASSAQEKEREQEPIEREQSSGSTVVRIDNSGEADADY